MSLIFRLVLIAAVLSPALSLAQKTESELVRETFVNYRTAALAGNGAEAFKWVDKKTKDYYKSILISAIHSDSAKVQEMNLIDRITVLTVRHKLPKEDVLRLEGSDQFLVYAIDNGLIAKSNIVHMEMGEVAIEGDKASGQLMAGGRAMPVSFQFRKEAGIWKFDITSLFASSTQGLKMFIESNGWTENQFIAASLEAVSGKPVNDEMWKPLKTK